MKNKISKLLLIALALVLAFAVLTCDEETPPGPKDCECTVDSDCHAIDGGACACEADADKCACEPKVYGTLGTGINVYRQKGVSDENATAAWGNIEFVYLEEFDTQQRTGFAARVTQVSTIFGVLLSHF